VRGKPGLQRRRLAVLPGRGAGQREPLHDESRMNPARAAKTWKASRPPGVVVHLVQGPEPGAAAAQPGHGSPPCSGTSHSQAAVAALMASSDPDRRPLTGPFRAHVRHRALAGPTAAGGG